MDLWDGVKEEWLGYYDDPRADAPTFDPGEAAPCLICRFPWTDDTVRTINICATSGDRSYFYRVHRACRDAQTQDEQDTLDGFVGDMSAFLSGPPPSTP